MENATDSDHGFVSPVDDGELGIAYHQLSSARPLTDAANQRLRGQSLRGIPDTLCNAIRRFDVVLRDVRPCVKIIAVSTRRPFKPPLADSF